MAADMDEKHLKVGELAAAAGLTVRALHHWDEIGLLTPSERSGAGYRIYGKHDVERLYRILALRSLGLDLATVARALEADGAGLRTLVERQLEELEVRIELEGRLKERLVRMRALLDQDDGTSPEELLDTIEVMTMIEKHYSQEQLAQLEERRRALGPEGMERAQRDWADLIAALEREREAGTDPAELRVQELVARWEELIRQFTGGDAGIRASLGRLYAEEGAERASRGMVSADLAQYLKQAVDARDGV